MEIMRHLVRMEKVDRVVSAEGDTADKRLEIQQIKSITVDTKGYEYPEPDVQH